MTLYFDTSIFVPLTVAEQKSDIVQSWFSEQDPQGIAISDWVSVEFRSALALKLRTGQIDAEIRSGAEDLFARFTSAHFTTVPVSRADFHRAGALVGREALKLRAGDALHLAIAERLTLEICTLDRHLFEAAVEVGIPAFTL